MPENKITPEDRLLKIIESPAEHTKSRVEFIRKQRGQFIPNLKQIFSFKKYNRAGGIKFKFSAFGLRFINIALLVLAVLVTLFSIFDFIMDKVHLKNRFNLISRSSQAEEQNASKLAFLSADDLEGVLKNTGEKNIFSLAPVSSANKTKAEVLEKDVSNLKLVGVLWSEHPQVMIEDAEAKRTYLLGVGEKISKWKVKK